MWFLVYLPIRTVVASITSTSRRDHGGAMDLAGDRAPEVDGTPDAPVERRDVLGGLIHEDRWAA